MTSRIKRVVTTISDSGHAVADAFSEVLINDKWFPLDPVSLDTTGPEWAAWQQMFGAAIISERDTLQSERDQLLTERDQLLTERDTLQAEVTRTSDRDQLASELTTVTSERDAKAQRVIELEGQIEALLHPVANPRHLAPFDFLELFTPEETYVVQTSSDPVVVVGRAKLQTITLVDLDHADTIGLVQYLEAASLIAAGRAAQILAGEPPT